MQQADDAAFADAFMHFVEAAGAQPLSDQPRRARAIVKQLWMDVEVAPPFRQFRHKRCDGVLEGRVHEIRPC